MRNKKPSFRKGRKPTQDQLKNILDLHWKWAFSEEGGQRADLERVNLSHCNLQNACLGGARRSRFIWCSITICRLT